MNLALFDLDHTLIPFDSGMAWTHFLVDAGVLAPEADSQYLAYCHQYVAGTLDIHAMHRASVAPLARFSRERLARWAEDFEQDIAARIPIAARALVQRHRDAGDVCAIVTATTRFIAEPFARLFDIPHVLATEAATADGSASGALTGEIDGLPCYREHKVTRVQDWLTAQRPAEVTNLSAFRRSWFYSDSASDLPLLQAVSDPVLVRPDERLQQRGRERGWPTLDLD
jgi:HAD superfamily hydrolase (TIGR01490 family)